MTVKRWIVREQQQERVASLARVLSVSPTVAALLLSRGCDNEQAARNFLKPSYEQLHDPDRMLGMSEAVARVLRAIEQKGFIERVPGISRGIRLRETHRQHQQPAARP